jgi:hypothetical protein
MTAVQRNQDLAAQAREIAASSPRGSIDRRSWGCVAVALDTTASLAAARRVLAEMPADDVQAAALDRLAAPSPHEHA